jgi:hypothetical protein
MSPLQQVIWELHSQGLGAKKIAARLGKSPDNIKTQLRRIKAKLEASSKNFDEDIDDILPKLETQQSQIEFLASRGYTTKQIAERTGASASVISAQKWRSKKQKKRRVWRYFLTGEELKALPAPPKNNRDYDPEVARILYRTYVQSDNINHEELSRLGTQGLGGWMAKKAVLSDRAKMLKMMIAAGREKTLTITEKESTWYDLISDMLPKYKRINDYTYIPEAWDIHEKEVEERIKAALATVKTKMIGYKNGVEVYEIEEQKETAVVIRPLDNNQVAIVGTAWKSDIKNMGKKGVEGIVGRDVIGFKIDTQHVDPAAVVFIKQGEKWVMLGADILRRGDKARLRGDSIIEVLRWDEKQPGVKIVQLKGGNLAWAVARFVIKKDCYLLAEGKFYDFRRVKTCDINNGIVA